MSHDTYILLMLYYLKILYFFLVKYFNFRIVRPCSALPDEPNPKPQQAADARTRPIPIRPRLCNAHGRCGRVVSASETEG